ncbi:hypothetical protein [Methylogaea oryzae]|uniref:Uncharacterized protein n=1 Tax=Methylogaea oryzae TaxID=1295382 RepID=A0A8D4VR20_9GAMM|nr:hypothetical protein [Methylogaea oryzae]BBL72142.1 hypothetical protein MoryE10_27480 [Methylogaea oryzae]
MKTETHDDKQTKVTVVAGRELLDSIKRHRESLRSLTGLSVSMSAAAAALIRAGLDAKRAAQGH